MALTESDKAFLENAIRGAIREALSQMIPPTSKKLVPAARACHELGFANKEGLYRAIELGTFRLGREVFDKRSKSSSRPYYVFDLAACRKRLEIPPAKRKAA